MKLGVYSLKKIHYQGEAASLNCKTASGEITVLDHHLPLVTMLEEGVIKIVDRSAKEHYLPVRSGFLETDGARTSVIIDEGI